MDQEYDVLGGYVPVFLQHLADTRARLGLGVDPQADENRNSVADALRADSEVDDLSDWTCAERDAFFRALSVYSRWRPDLITACVPTRSEWEIWTYLEALEEGATGRVGSEDVEMRVDESVSGSDDSDEDTDDCTGESEGEVVCQPALEVSQAWIDVEEQMAAWIVRKEEWLASGEGEGEGEGDGASDAEEPVEEPPAKRPRGRPKGRPLGSGKARAPSRRVGSDDDDRPPPYKSARRYVRNASVSTAQQREEEMGRLELPHLLVLDNILREGEEPMRNGSKSREGSEALAELGDEEMAEADGVEASSLSNRASAPQGTRTAPSNAVIDPVLLALSGEADPTGQRQLAQDPSESTLVGCAPAQASSSLPEGPSESTSLGVSSQPLFQLDSAGADQAPNVESDMLLLSPRSRRRLQKRLYMRRKRAILGENAVDTSVGKLKPGKKAKSEQSKMPVVSTPAPCSEEHSDAEMEPDENRKKNKGGTTLPYKIKALFSELDVDAAYLRSQGMDLLNLSALGRLMGLFGGDEEDESDTAQSIDAELVRNLQAGMVSFVTEVIHKAIVWREREIRLKQRCQAWRPGDQITIGTIEHAVDVIGARYHSHKEYFKSLEGLDGSPTGPSESDDGPDSESVYPPHREAYTPLVRLPSAWRMGPLVSLTRTYEREATRSRRGPSADLDEDDLMADETDEEALATELREEEEMDVTDMKVSATEEEVLLNRLKIT